MASSREYNGACEPPEKSSIPPPAAPMAGMAALGKDRSGIFTENLTPGNYGLICFVNDAKDHKPHSEHGMTTEFTIAAK